MIHTLYELLLFRSRKRILEREVDHSGVTVTTSFVYLYTIYRCRAVDRYFRASDPAEMVVDPLCRLDTSVP